jgi:L-ascorbate metabolism protein UlaG (beta-lactamase superfamily)
MKLQLWRNATLQLTIYEKAFLIDPMLGKKGSLGVFPWTDDQSENPLVNLPFTDDQLASKMRQIDAVFVSHLHPDHWDEAAINLIDKTTPLICSHVIAGTIASYGFKNVQQIQSQLTLSQIKLHLTSGQHGRGEIGEKMGQVSGIVFEYQGNRVYLAGDTIWCGQVKEAIDKYQPQHIVVAGGAATFAIGEPVTMSAQDIQQVAAYTPTSTIWITHLEAVSPCKEGRHYLKEFLIQNNLEDQCKILADGEEAVLSFL